MRERAIARPSTEKRGALAIDTDLLAVCAANLAAVGAHGRDVVDVGPFRAFLSPKTDEYLMSFAVPVAESDDWPAAAAALAAAFRERNRVPRLELFEEIHAAAAAGLAAVGISRQSAQPVMAVTRPTLRPRRLVQTVYVRLLDRRDDALLKAMIDVQTIAFDAPLALEGERAWRDLLTDGMDRGGVVVAVAIQDGRVVCCASLQIGGGAAELCGVGTLPGYRRRGLASGLCTRLIGEAFKRGIAQVWLSAGDPVAEAVYRRLGFRRIGTQLNCGADPD